MTGSFIIIDAHEQQYLDHIRTLFKEYEEALKDTPCFEEFDREIAALPTPYGPPFGCLLLALVDGHPGGCVALKPHSDLTCEMKRLFVRPEYRGLQVGRELVHRFLNRSVQLGYTKIHLHTIPQRMPQAVVLYKSLGFRPVEFDQQNHDQILHMEYSLPVSRR